MSSPLTVGQVLALAREFFPETQAIVITAVAKRESKFYPDAHNNNSGTGDDSYGLLQINRLIWAKDEAAGLKQLGIWKWDDLFDPRMNIRAGSLLWAHNNHNLDVCWYINREPYKTKYEQYLGEVVRVALGLPLVAGSGSGVVVPPIKTGSL